MAKRANPREADRKVPIPASDAGDLWYWWKPSALISSWALDAAAEGAKDLEKALAELKRADPPEQGAA